MSRTHRIKEKFPDGNVHGLSHHPFDLASALLERPLHIDIYGSGAAIVPEVVPH